MSGTVFGVMCQIDWSWPFLLPVGKAIDAYPLPHFQRDRTFLCGHQQLRKRYNHSSFSQDAQLGLL